ncbi:CD82 antigen [Bombina bombina]|uniref:CD82 antigen n=1 Tax=Bombina bombina TaxID=8345 RepID=UPI00235AEB39|nr:CD82 antigen [Bombina bombina]
MADGCLKVTKYFLFVFNLLFFILGAVILGFGIWILADKTSFISVLHNSSENMRIGSYILIAVGGVTMVMGILGCVGAVNEVRCLLGLYFTFLLIILIAQVVAGVLIYFQQDKLKLEMESIVNKTILTYEEGNYTSADNVWDYIQSNLKCCGWTDYKIWTMNPALSNNSTLYPCSCGTVEIQTSGFCNSSSTDWPVYKKGCMDGVKSWLQDNLGIILGVCVGVAVIELLGLILSICLCRNIQSEDYSKVPKY